MRKFLTYTAVVAIALIGGFYAFNSYIYHEKKADSEGKMCAQVLTDARDPSTGHVETFPTPCDVPDGWEVLTGENTTFQRGDELLRAYENNQVGLRFEYRVEPDGYILIDQEEEYVSDETLVEHISLFDTSDYLELVVSSVPREGPPGITVFMFSNPTNRSPEEWVNANERFSNIQLALTDIVDTTVSGMPAVRYTTDGLYTTDNVVVTHENHSIMFSGGYAYEDAVIRDDFEELLNSVSLY